MLICITKQKTFWITYVAENDHKGSHLLISEKVCLRSGLSVFELIQKGNYRNIY